MSCKRTGRHAGTWRAIWTGLAALSVSAGLVMADNRASVAQENLPAWLRDAFKSDIDAREAETKAARERRREAMSVLAPPSLTLGVDAELNLKSAIEYYSGIVARGGWPMIPTKGRKLEQGAQDERVTVLRQRLEITGDLRVRSRYPYVFDEHVAEAVKRYQLRNGLPPTAELDRPTLAALNTPAETRLHQLRLNLVRMQEMNRTGLPERYVMVNIPAFELQAIEAGRTRLQSKVVVGRPEAATPTINAKIKGLNFFPYWHVPETIAHRDLIPLLAKDPGYLDREHIRLVKYFKGEPVDTYGIDWRNPPPEVREYKFQQDPGPWNALGLVRVNMPNEHIVYMHDTPLKNLFGRAARAFSAGCVRVEKIFELVTWLASLNGDWDRARVDSVLASGQPLDLDFENPVEVRFVYMTAWAGEGAVHFREDIYGRDGTNVLLASYESEERPTSGLSP